MDGDLEAIRARALASMKESQGGRVPATEEEQEKQQEAQRGAEEQRRGMLVAVTTHEARERLSRIALVKPDKARAIENMILGAAQRGQLSEKVSEQRLVSMLEQISEKQGGGPKITIQRRRFDDD
ncbi:PDCD5-related protein [Haematococcus lacustris]